MLYLPFAGDGNGKDESCLNVGRCAFEAVNYYNESRIHRSLSKDAPFPHATERLGVITSQPVLGGLHHEYCRV
jgi:hypothetical protein